MPKKEYSLLSTEPLTEFDNFLLRALKEMTEHGVKPRAALFAVLDEDGKHRDLLPPGEPVRHDSDARIYRPGHPDRLPGGQWNSAAGGQRRL